MARVDQRLAVEAVALGGHAFVAQAVEVLHVHPHRVDRFDAGGAGARQAQIAGQPEGAAMLAGRGAVVTGTERGGQVFGAPHQAPDPRAAIAVAAQGEEGIGRFGHDRHDAGRAWCDAMRGLEGVQVVGNAAHVIAMAGLGQHDAVRPVRHHGGQIVDGQAGVQRIDAHEQRLPAVRGGQHGGGDCPGFHLAGRRHRVFQVEDQRIGRAFARLLELAGAIARHEEHGAHRHRHWCRAARGGGFGSAHAGCRRMKAERVHRQMTSSR